MAIEGHNRGKYGSQKIEINTFGVDLRSRNAGRIPIDRSERSYPPAVMRHVNSAYHRTASGNILSNGS